MITHSIELPKECVKECGTFVFDRDDIEKRMQTMMKYKNNSNLSKIIH